MTSAFDRRLHPVRPDLASSSYQGRVQAQRFVDGNPMRVCRDMLDLRPQPNPEAGIDTQALFGETFTVFETTVEGWAWGQLGTDGYVGWVSDEGLTSWAQPTHRVRALRSYRYPPADLRFPPLGLVSMGSLVTVTGTTTTRDLEYALLDDGSAMVAKHLVPLDHVEADWVSVAEEFLGTPYLWAGRSSLGLDCSALVQMAAQAGGLAVLRDSDMQATDAGDLLEDWQLASLERGDLVFWKGHVAIVQGENRILHANGHTMTVASEPLDAAVVRIAANEYGKITVCRRL
ncbi:NlpC/P60 family protein [Roseibium sp.]|uniref:C40 family peptidase n=1 Tax=Roseibium sp. TaxID=1936156 RepID=UPI003A9847EC